MRTIRRNYFVPERHYTALGAFNRRLLTRTEKENDPSHYKKGMRVGDLFEQERSSLQPLNPKPFRAVRYRLKKADKYGKIQADCQHFYSMSPEMGGRELMVELSAEKVRIFEGDVLLAIHKRSYGQARTYSSNPWNTLTYLIQHPQSWFNSQLRLELNESLRELLDRQEEPKRMDALEALEMLCQDSTPKAACEALEEALEQGTQDFSQVAVLALRIQQGGMEPPPCPVVNLADYDRFLKLEEVKK